MEDKEIVFTRHAQERIDQRLINREMIRSVVLYPAKQYEGENGTVKLIRRINGKNIHVVTKPVPEENKVLIISAWVRGQNDDGTTSVYKRPYQQYERRNPKRRSDSIDLNPILWALVFGLSMILVMYFLSRGGI